MPGEFLTVRIRLLPQLSDEVVVSFERADPKPDNQIAVPLGDSDSDRRFAPTRRLAASVLNCIEGWNGSRSYFSRPRH
jgi:hypothetical protein